jgi:hypothetical protein
LVLDDLALDFQLESDTFVLSICWVLPWVEIAEVFETYSQSPLGQDCLNFLEESPGHSLEAAVWQG